MKSIKELARKLNVDVDKISKAAMQIGVSSRDARDNQFVLSTPQCNQIGELFNSKDSSISTAIQKPNVTPAGNSAPEQKLVFKNDLPVKWSEIKFPSLKHSILGHEDVLEAVSNLKHTRKRLRIVLEHLASLGKTSIVKSCKNAVNRGWRRSPLGGGSNGMQYYLWWAPQGNQPVKKMDIPTGGIVIRSVRNHDDHSPLVAGDLNNYTPIEHLEIENENQGFVESPWSADQLQFVNSSEPVRVVIGHPGSGKTTALWKAVVTRNDQRVLYLTWSNELTQNAQKHFETFASVDSVVLTFDFLTFLGKICNEDIKRLTIAESQALFQKEIAKIDASLLRAWIGREKALYAELRGFLLGRALPEHKDAILSKDILRLSDAAYLERRSNEIGKDAAKEVLIAFNAIEQKINFKEIFPELVAANRAVKILKSGHIKEENLLNFDRIVVDEIQDLTLVELTVIVELCRAIARKSCAPGLLVAGDDGQTVRPSGFNWGAINKLLSNHIKTPKEFELTENLRCPTRIADVVERASYLYSIIGKPHRPQKQSSHSGGQHAEAYIFYVNATKTEAIEFLKNSDEMDGVKIILPQSEIPKWVPGELQKLILTPMESKGLEYQSVCVLETGKLLAQLKKDGNEHKASKLDEHVNRTIIDQLRVALSRATETLTFIDVEASEIEREYSRELLGDPATSSLEDLKDYFTNSGISTEEMVQIRLNDAHALLENKPQRAWDRAFQAFRLLGDRNLPNGVFDDKLRQEVHNALLGISSHFIVNGYPGGVNKNEILKIVEESIKARSGFQKEENAFRQLAKWCHDRSLPPFELLKATIDLGEGGEWLRNSLSGIFQSIRKSLDDYSSNIVTAKEFVGDVEGWLKILKYMGDIPEEAHRLRGQAADALMTSKDMGSLEGLMKFLPEDHFRVGQLMAIKKNYSGAIKELSFCLEVGEGAKKKDLLRKAEALKILGSIFLIQAQFNAAEIKLKESLELKENLLGQKSSEIEEILDKLSEAYRLQNKFAEAEAPYQRLLKLKEKEYGKDSLKFAEFMQNYGEILFSIKKYDEAENYLVKALAIKDKVQGGEHFTSSAILEKLQRIYCVEKISQIKAEAILVRLKKIKEKKLGFEHNDVIDIGMQLGICYLDQNRYQSSENIYKPLLQLLMRKFGKEHPRVKEILDGLRIIYSKQSNPDSLAEVLDQLLKLKLSKKGESQQEIMDLKTELADAYCKMNHYKSADSLIEEVLVFYRKGVHADTNKLAKLLIKYGDYLIKGYDAKWALELYEECIVIKEPVLGSEHIEVIKLLEKISDYYYQQEEYESAEKYFVRILSSKEKAHGLENVEVVLIIQKMISLYTELKNFDQAEKMIEKVLAIDIKYLNNNLEKLCKLIGLLCNTYYKENLFDKEALLVEKLILIKQKSSDYDHIDQLFDMIYLNKNYIRRNEIAKAKVGLQNAFDIYEKAPKALEIKLSELLTQKGEICFVEQIYEDAENYFNLALKSKAKFTRIKNNVIADCNSRLGSIYFMKGKNSLALKHLEKAILLKRSDREMDKQEMVTICCQVAELLTAQGKYHTVIKRLDLALEIQDKVFGPISNQVADVYCRMGKTYAVMKKDWKALSCFGRALEISKKINGNDHPTTNEIALNISEYKNEVVSTSLKFE